MSHINIEKRQWRISVLEDSPTQYNSNNCIQLEQGRKLYERSSSQASGPSWKLKKERRKIVASTNTFFLCTSFTYDDSHLRLL